jgi:DNA-3-methyladenine glycosylase
MGIIPLTFYKNSDVLYLAKNLLGKYLLTKFEGVVTGGIIMETEAYRGPEDRASHAYGNRRTKRNEAMFQEGGVCYIYIVYGIHLLFNVVTNVAEIPHAILIRAIKPEVGIEEMLKRRKKTKLDKTLAAGPGSLSQALGIDRSSNGLPLDKPPIWIEDRGIVIKTQDVLMGPRKGIAYAGEDALLPWRYRVRDMLS